MQRAIIILTVVTLVAPMLCSAAILENLGQNTETYTGFDNSDTDWWAGWWHQKSQWTGEKGVYTMTSVAEAIGNVWPLEVYAWFNPDTGTRTLDGWRQKELDICQGTKSVNWAVDFSVQITGSLNADNDFITPFGDTEVYAWSKMILSGLADKTIETKGDPYHIEEGTDTTVGVSDPIHVSLPINVSEDTAPLNGDHADSSSGTKADATDGSHIRVRGRVVGRSHTWDGGREATGTIKCMLQTFTLTENS